MAYDSSSAGNYWDSPESSKTRDKTGAKECGGYRDGQGNIHKIVTSEGNYVLIGGMHCFDGEYYPVACITCGYPYNIRHYGSGVLVLLK